MLDVVKEIAMMVMIGVWDLCSLFGPWCGTSGAGWGEQDSFRNPLVGKVEYGIWGIMELALCIRSYMLS